MKYDFTEEMQTFQRNQDLDIDSPSRFTYKKELAAIDSDVGDDPNVLSSNFAPINEKSGSTSGVNANDSKKEPERGGSFKWEHDAERSLPSVQQHLNS